MKKQTYFNVCKDLAAKTVWYSARDLAAKFPYLNYQDDEQIYQLVYDIMKFLEEDRTALKNWGCRIPTTK